MDLKLSRYMVVTDEVIDPINGREKRILFGARTGVICHVDVKHWERLLKGDFGSAPRHLIKKLTEAKVLVHSQEDELSRVLAENREAIAHYDRLVIGVHPSADCQLACDYCGQRHRPQKLSHENQDLFIQRVRSKLAAGRYHELKVCWTGGEPLLALNVIRNMSPKFRAIADNFDCAYISDIMTNGLLLTPEVASELSKKHGISCANVTLDGTAVYHDRRRCDKKGAPTFRRIFQNVTTLAQRDDLELELEIRCNVDHRNREAVFPLIHLLVDHRVHDRIERLYMAPVHPWVNDSDKISENPEEFALWEIGWLSEMKRLGFRNVDLIPQRVKSMCFALDPEAELVDAFGNLFNCSEVSYVPPFEKPPIPEWRSGPGSNIYSIGSLPKGEGPGKRNLLALFNDRIEQGEISCDHCEILPVCGGACPKRWNEGLVPCPPVKFNIDRRLILDYNEKGFGPGAPRAIDKGSLVALAKNRNFQRCLSTDKGGEMF